MALEFAMLTQIYILFVVMALSTFMNASIFIMFGAQMNHAELNV